MQTVQTQIRPLLKESLIRFYTICPSTNLQLPKKQILDQKGMEENVRYFRTFTILYLQFIVMSGFILLIQDPGILENAYRIKTSLGIRITGQESQIS